MSNGNAETATTEQIATMIALQTLLRNGFIAVPYGNDPSTPDELGFVRLRYDIQELIRVYGQDEASAVRLIGNVPKDRAEGTAVEVVATVLDWPQIVSASGTGYDGRKLHVHVGHRTVGSTTCACPSIRNFRAPGPLVGPGEGHNAVRYLRDWTWKRHPRKRKRPRGQRD